MKRGTERGDQRGSRGGTVGRGSRTRCWKGSASISIKKTLRCHALDVAPVVVPHGGGASRGTVELLNKKLIGVERALARPKTKGGSRWKRGGPGPDHGCFAGPVVTVKRKLTVSHHGNLFAKHDGRTKTRLAMN